MSPRTLKTWLLIAGVAAIATVPSSALAQDDPASGQYTESAPTFQPAEPEPAPAPDPAPAPAPAPAQQSEAPAPAPSATPAPTATTAAEQLPVTGADPRLGLAGAALLILGLALRRRARLS